MYAQRMLFKARRQWILKKAIGFENLPGTWAVSSSCSSFVFFQRFMQYKLYSLYNRKSPGWMALRSAQPLNYYLPCGCGMYFILASPFHRQLITPIPVLKKATSALSTNKHSTCIDSCSNCSATTFPNFSLSIIIKINRDITQSNKTNINSPFSSHSNN